MSRVFCGALCRINWLWMNFRIKHMTTSLLTARDLKFWIRNHLSLLRLIYYTYWLSPTVEITVPQWQWSWKGYFLSSFVAIKSCEAVCNGNKTTRCAHFCFNVAIVFRNMYGIDWVLYVKGATRTGRSWWCYECTRTVAGDGSRHGCAATAATPTPYQGYATSSATTAPLRATGQYILLHKHLKIINHWFQFLLNRLC